MQTYAEMQRTELKAGKVRNLQIHPSLLKKLNYHKLIALHNSVAFSGSTQAR